MSFSPPHLILDVVQPFSKQNLREKVLWEVWITKWTRSCFIQFPKQNQTAQKSDPYLSGLSIGQLSLFTKIQAAQQPLQNLTKLKFFVCPERTTSQH